MSRARFKLYLDTRDKGVCTHILMDGYREIWAPIFIAQQLRPGMTVIDVGAHYGYYTLLMAEVVGLAGRVIAVESNPAAAAMLCDSVAMHPYAARITVVAAAAGAEEAGEGLLFVPEGKTRRRQDCRRTDGGSGQGSVFRVPRITLDGIASELPRVDFVKIDAEGAEEAILGGMRRTIARDKPGLAPEFNATRGDNPAAMLGELVSIYGQLHYSDLRGEAVPTTAEHLLATRRGAEWMLCLGFPLRGTADR